MKLGVLTASRSRRCPLTGIFTAFRLAGYEGAISIEHEDAVFSVDEGFRKAVAFLRQVMPAEPPLTKAWWTE